MPSSTTEPPRPRRKLRVLHIISGDLWAGAEVQLVGLVRAQSRRDDICPHVVALNPGRLYDEIRRDRISIDLLDESQLSSGAILTRLMRIIRHVRPDIVHTHRTKENILGSFATLLSTRCASVRTLHGFDEHPARTFQFRKRIIESLDDLLARRVQSLTVAVSRDIHRILLQRFPENRIAQIDNGIDMQSMTTSRPKRSDADIQGTREYLIGIVGRLVRVKRVDLFIEIARRFREARPDLTAKFLIVGDGPLRNDLEQLCRSLDLQSVVEFAGHTDDVPGIMGRLDLLVMTSDHEGLPIALLEAMALETPVVARDVGGVSEVLDGGRLGRLVNGNDPGYFVDAIIEVLEPGPGAGDALSGAREWVERHYSADVCARNHQRAYVQVLAT